MVSLDPEKIREAAKGSREVERVLRTLFPEAFVPTCEISSGEIVVVLDTHVTYIGARKAGPYQGRGIYVDNVKYGEWKLVREKYPPNGGEFFYVLLPPGVEEVK